MAKALLIVLCALQDGCTAAALATANGYAVTSQAIMGYAADFQLGKPVIEFIDHEMRFPTKKKPTSVIGRIGEFFGSLFGSSTNEDGTVRRGCLSSVGDKFSSWKVKWDDFEFKSMFKKKKDSIVFPNVEEGGEDQEVDVMEF